jgi:hypothetical protein
MAWIFGIGVLCLIVTGVAAFLLRRYTIEAFWVRDRQD